jgi:hypothetical protein
VAPATSRSSRTGGKTVIGLRDFERVPWLLHRSCLLQWQRHPVHILSIDGFDPGSCEARFELSTLLEEMLMHGASDSLHDPSQSREASPLQFASTESRCCLLRDLEKNGLCRGSEAGCEQFTHSFDYALTRQALDQLNCGCAVIHPKAVLAQGGSAPSISLDSRHPLHLVLALVDAGWEWQKFSRERMLQAPPYQVGKPQVWYSVGVTASCVDAAYLKALLDSERLKGLGVLAIPHGHPATVYEDLLVGKTPKLAAIAAMPAARKRKELGDLEMDVDGVPGGHPHCTLLRCI